jgi:hypothetical protein
MNSYAERKQIEQEECHIEKRKKYTINTYDYLKAIYSHRIMLDKKQPETQQLKTIEMPS